MSMYENLAEHYEQIFPFQPAHKKFILSAGTHRHSHCDIGCATGALAEHLAQQIQHVEAFDISCEMIGIARERNVHGVHYFCGEMKKTSDYFFNQKFDTISCFGNTIVHLWSEEEIADFFKQVYSIVEVNGVFQGQIINYDKVLKEKIASLPTISNEQVKFQRHYNYNPNSDLIDFDTKLYIKSSGAYFEERERLYPLKKDSLEKLLLAAGFSSVTFYADFDRTPYDPENLRLVFEAKN